MTSGLFLLSHRWRGGALPCFADCVAAGGKFASTVRVEAVLPGRLFQ